MDMESFTSIDKVATCSVCGVFLWNAAGILPVMRFELIGLFGLLLL